MSAQSALVIPIPDAERLVGTLREKHDPSAISGMEAHVTVLFPFADPARIDAGIEDRLTKVLAAASPFDVVFPKVGSFPGVLYLEPEPRVSLVALAQAVFRAFPEYPPYGGRHGDVVPHLTVGVFSDAAALERVRGEIGEALNAMPPRAKVAAVELLDNRSGRWVKQRAFPLGRDAS